MILIYPQTTYWDDVSGEKGMCESLHLERMMGFGGIGADEGRGGGGIRHELQGTGGPEEGTMP
jgi:hypothetical protein